LGLWDPEVGQSSSGRGNYHPQLKTFSFGANLTF
jgi:hypothetical protein